MSRVLLISGVLTLLTACSTEPEGTLSATGQDASTSLSDAEVVDRGAVDEVPDSSGESGPTELDDDATSSAQDDVMTGGGQVDASVAEPEVSDATTPEDAEEPEPQPTCDPTLTPVMMVHGGLANSGTMSELVMRFHAAGHCKESVATFDWNSFADIDAATVDVKPDAPTPDDLDDAIDALLKASGHAQTHLLAHSAGGLVCYVYLADPERAAKIVRYAHVGSFRKDGPPGPEGAPVESLNLQSAVDVETQFVPVGTIPQMVNTRFTGDHLQVLSSIESFRVLYDFLYEGLELDLTVIPAEEPVLVGGRVMSFGENIPSPGAVLDIYLVEPETGLRTSEEPDASFTAGPDGAWGPYEVIPSARLEVVVKANEGPTIHYHFFAPERSTNLFHMMTLPPAPAAAGLVTAAVSMTGTHANLFVSSISHSWMSGRDSLRVDGVELVTASLAPPEKVLTLLMLTDDGDGQSSFASSPLFSEFFFIDSLDMHLDASEAGTVAVEMNGQVMNVGLVPAENDAFVFAFFADSFPGVERGEEAWSYGPGECGGVDDCDDGLACTVDTCTEGVCGWALMAGACLIGNVCYTDGQVTPNAQCEVCDPSKNAFGWSLAAPGLACDDGDVCTAEDVCDGETCVGAPVVCEGSGPCTLGQCEAGIGCINVAGVDGVECDDGTACTELDACLAGLCVGVEVNCDDGLPCTADSCDAIDGCANTPFEGECDDGDPCTGGDTCLEGECVPGLLDGCDDGNPCTLDICDEVFGCGHLPVQTACCTGEVSVCDDGNPCTIDSCDPDTQDCAYTDAPLGTACDDGDACTAPGMCEAGGCVAPPVDCDDGNPCTDNTCDPVTGGCASALITGVACDDGLECSTDDACLEGVCVADLSQCECEPVFTGDALKTSSMAIGSGGVLGQGLDVDGDSATCAPSSGCSDGVDNSFGAMAALANAQFQESLASGEVMLVMELVNGGTSLVVHQAKLAPSNPECDFMTTTCDYLVDPAGLDGSTCDPAVEMPVTIDGTALSAGGPGTVLPFDVPLPGAALQMVIYDTQIQAELTYEDGQVVGLSGLMAGAITKDVMVASVQALPDDAGLPVPKESMIALLDLTLEYDIDTDGDGEKDAASIGMPFVAIDANILGVWEQ